MSAATGAVVLASAAGAVVEWFDFARHDAAPTLFINRFYFPTLDLDTTPLVSKNEKDAAALIHV